MMRQSPTQIKSPHALIADGRRDARLLVKYILRRREYITDEASDATETYQKLRNCRYDLVVLDIEMSGIDKHTIAHEIRNGHVGQLNRELCIVGCGVMDWRKYEITPELTGLDLYFSKPLIAREFGAKIDAILGRTAVNSQVVA